MKTVIHVNQHRIKGNRKHGTLDPVLTTKTYKSNDYGHCAEILDAEGEKPILPRPEKAEES